MMNTLRRPVFACCLFFAPALAAQSPLPVARLSQPVQLDGRVDEAAWASATRLTLTMQKPDFGSEPSEATDVFLAYDDDYLYLAGRMHVSDPALIRGPIYRRDISDSASDYFGIIVDNFNDKENALAFFTSPTGLRWDATIVNDAEGANPINREWNSFWDLATSRGPLVWQAEMRIPFSTLRIQEQDGRVVMGLTCFRYQGAKAERDVFPAFPERWGSMSVWKPSQAREIVLENVRSRRPLYITPYLLAGVDQRSARPDGADGFGPARQAVREVGADLKYGLTNDLTLDLTVNTDFSQVDNDEGQVNLTRFSLFLPERRQFFLERAGIFDFSFDDVNRLFYSRRIGLQNGDPTRIYYGARLVGRVGQQDVGLLNMQTGATGKGPAENFTVLRTRRRVFNENSYLGAMLTNRADLRGTYHAAAGLDGLFRVTGDEYLSVKLARTFREDTSAAASPGGSRLALRWERRRFNGFSYRVDLARAGNGYDPAMGFEQRRDYHSLDAEWAYGWTAAPASPLLRLQTYVRTFAARQNESGRLESGIVEAGAWLETKNTWKAHLEVYYDRERIDRAFALTRAANVPEETYAFLQARASVTTPQTRMFSTRLDVSGGGFYDGRLLALGLSPTWKANAHLEFSATYQLNRITFAERGQRDLTHLGRLRLQYFWNTRWSAVLFVQYNDLDRQVLSNLRLQYTPREGTDLFIVFNDVTNRQGENTPALAADSRKVLVKYAYTFGR